MLLSNASAGPAKIASENVRFKSNITHCEMYYNCSVSVLLSDGVDISNATISMSNGRLIELLKVEKCEDLNQTDNCVFNATNEVSSAAVVTNKAKLVGVTELLIAYDTFTYTHYVIVLETNR